jgi:hypothetical protein
MNFCWIPDLLIFFTMAKTKDFAPESIRSKKEVSLHSTFPYRIRDF